MKKILSILFLVLCIGCLASCKGDVDDDRPTLTVGMECAYAPFNWTETFKTETNYPIDGTQFYAEGYDVQIAKKLQMS